MNKEMLFYEAVKARRSVRAFKTRKIEPEIMTRLLKPVQSAPTAGNLQAYQVYLVETPEVIRALAKAAHNQTCVLSAPAVLVFCTDANRSTTYGKRGKTLYCLQDATIAATIAHLAAVASGLGSVMVGAFEETGVARAIDAPAAQAPILMLPLGYPDETPAPTSRRLLDDLVIRR